MRQRLRLNALRKNGFAATPHTRDFSHANVAVGGGFAWTWVELLTQTSFPPACLTWLRRKMRHEIMRIETSASPAKENPMASPITLSEVNFDKITVWAMLKMPIKGIKI